MREQAKVIAVELMHKLRSGELSRIGREEIRLECYRSAPHLNVGQLDWLQTAVTRAVIESVP